jgi:Zn-dependent protease with chaperone function
MRTANPVSLKTCPNCSAEIPVYEGSRPWCERCDWNLESSTARTGDEGFFARHYVRLGERYGKMMLASLKSAQPEDLRPRWTVRKGLAFLLASSVHVLSLTLFLAGVFLFTRRFPDVPLMLLGALACAFAWLMRPKPGKVPVKDIVSPKDFPALYGLVNEIVQKLGGRPINHIAVNEDFNAAYGVVGWRRVSVLWIGLPLWMALRPQERIALLSHEAAHGVNGDATRSFIVGSALEALDEWLGLLRGPLAHASVWDEMLAGYLYWILSLPVAAVQSLLAQLLWLNKQQAEYFADYLAAKIAGTDAAVSTLQRLGCSDYLDEVLNRNAYSTSQSGAYILGLFRQRIASLPDREWQRLAHVAGREGARLDASHPPTAYRIDALSAHFAATPALIAEDGTMSAADAELKALEERIGRRLIARYASD